MKKFKKPSHLMVGGIISSIILITLLFFRFYNSPALHLETRWLVLAGVPLLIALIIGGHIHKLKGFGLELETRLKAPPSGADLVATNAVSQLAGRQKEGIDQLMSMTSVDLKKIVRLIFVEGRRDYYQPYVISDYFGMLESLSYLEVRKEDGEFLALIPKKHFFHRKELNHPSIEKFAASLEHSTVREQFGMHAIVDFVMENIPLLDVLKLMRKLHANQVAVVDENHKFIGLLKRATVERRIVDSVMDASAGG